VTGDREDLTGAVRRRHAERLLDQGRTIAAAVRAGTDVAEGAVSLHPAEDTSLRLALNWRPNGFHAPLLLATERGFYRDAGVDVAVEPARGSGAALERVASGTAGVGIVGSAVLGRALDSGQPVVPVALFYQRAMTVLYTVRSVFGERLDSVEQLRGRTVAMPAGSETALLARLFLSQSGVVDDVTDVDTGGEERTALLDGTADVVTGMAADPPELEAEGYTVDSILVAEQFPVPGPALVVHADSLRTPPPALGGFLTGTMRGVVAADHDRTAAATAVAGQSEDTVEAERRRLDVALGTFAGSDAVRSHGWGWQSVEDWRRLLTALRQTGTLEARS
jgi:ABC-type nitrate/sulfonate/bicarbonate transport system substrate-binding protein